MTMKTQIQKCSICNEETIHDIGKKQATNRSKAYTRRITTRCRKCGTKEVNNMKMGKRIIRGHNLPEKEDSDKD